MYLARKETATPEAANGKAKQRLWLFGLIFRFLVVTGTSKMSAGGFTRNKNKRGKRKDLFLVSGYRCGSAM